MFYTRLTFFSLLVCALPTVLWGQSVQVEGFYQGKNLYIQNPKTPQGYCITSAHINGEAYAIPASSAFSLNLDAFALGAPLSIALAHHAGCLPKIINIQVIEPKDLVLLTQPQVSAHYVAWEIQGSAVHGRCFVLRRQADKTALVAVINAEKQGEYRAKVEHLVGENIYFIKYLDYTGAVVLSEEASFAQSQNISAQTSELGNYFAPPSASQQESVPKEH